MDTNGADKIFRGINACKSGPWGGPFRELFLILGCLIMGRPTAQLSELGLLFCISYNYHHYRLISVRSHLTSKCLAVLYFHSEHCSIVQGVLYYAPST